MVTPKEIRKSASCYAADPRDTQTRRVKEQVNLSGNTGAPRQPGSRGLRDPRMTFCLESNLLASSGGNEMGGDQEEVEQRKTGQGSRGKTSGQGLGQEAAPPDHDVIIHKHGLSLQPGSLATAA